MEVLLLFFVGVFGSAIRSARRDETLVGRVSLLAACLFVAVALMSHRLA